MVDTMRRSFTVLALLQVGAIVIGMIAGGVAARRLAECGASNAGVAMWFRNYGFLLVGIPILWLWASIHFCRKSYTSTWKEVLMFVFGLVVLGGLAYGAFKASVFGMRAYIDEVSEGESLRFGRDGESRSRKKVSLPKIPSAADGGASVARIRRGSFRIYCADERIPRRRHWAAGVRPAAAAEFAGSIVVGRAHPRGHRPSRRGKSVPRGAAVAVVESADARRGDLSAGISCFDRPRNRCAALQCQVRPVFVVARATPAVSIGLCAICTSRCCRSGAWSTRGARRR